MNKAIDDYTWDPCFESDDIDDICQNWTSLFLNIAKQLIPNQAVDVTPKDIPWFNSDRRKLKWNKDRVHYKAKSSHNLNDWANFCHIRNEYRDKRRGAESKYIEKLATSLKDTQNINPKKLCHITKQFMGTVKNSIILLM